MRTLAIKTPSEANKSYAFDLTDWMKDLGTTVSSADSLAAESGLTVGGASVDASGYVVTFATNGGTAGNDYTVTLSFTTADGQQLQGFVNIPVRAQK